MGFGTMQQKESALFCFLDVKCVVRTEQSISAIQKIAWKSIWGAIRAKKYD